MDARDVAAGAAAERKGRTGQSYLLTGQAGMLKEPFTVPEASPAS